MTVALPGGGVGQIEYTGNVPPRVYVSDAPAMPAAFAAMPAMPAMFGAQSPFAALDRISADMDRQMALMWRQAAALSALPAAAPEVTEASLRNMPAGGEGYTSISTLSGNGVCTRSVEITATGNGAAPRVVSHSSGSCGASQPPQGGATGVVTAPARSAPVTRPDVLWTKNERPAYARMVKEAALR